MIRRRHGHGWNLKHGMVAVSHFYRKEALVCTSPTLSFLMVTASVAFIPRMSKRGVSEEPILLRDSVGEAVAGSPSRCCRACRAMYHVDMLASLDCRPSAILLFDRHYPSIPTCTRHA